MSIQFNSALGTHTATDRYGVVLAIYDPDTHGTLADFQATARALVEG
jgi:hypothetical protein